MNFFQTPFNYAGNKFKLLEKLFQHFPQQINTLYEPFAGGMTVSYNFQNAKKYQCYDTNKYIIDLCNILKDTDTEKIYKDIEDIIISFGFSRTYIHSKEPYIASNIKLDKNGKQNTGLDEYNKEPYIKLRSSFNEMIVAENYDTYKISLYFYVLLVHSYNYQFRFNSKGFFNMPNGRGDWNLKMQEKLFGFIKNIKQKDISFHISDFKNFNFENIKKDDLVYLDPPYLISTASYNENKGWTENDEKELLSLTQKFIDKDIRFVLSNVIEHKDIKNILLKEFVEKNNLTLIDMQHKYKSHGAKRKKTDAQTIEVIVKNF